MTAVGGWSQEWWLQLVIFHHLLVRRLTLPPIIMEVKNGCISNSSYLSNAAIFHWTMIMGERVRPSLLQPRFLIVLNVFKASFEHKNQLATFERKYPKKITGTFQNRPGTLTCEKRTLGRSQHEQRKQNPWLPFLYTGWFSGILILDPNDPHITGVVKSNMYNKWPGALGHCSCVRIPTLKTLIFVCLIHLLRKIFHS